MTSCDGLMAQCDSKFDLITNTVPSLVIIIIQFVHWHKINNRLFLFQFQCDQPCKKFYKGCKKDHRCNKLCYDECKECPFEEDVNLSCGHKFTLSCPTDLSSVKCQNLCDIICPQCNLKCMKKCWMDCDPCTNKVSGSAVVCNRVQYKIKSHGTKTYFCFRQVFGL